MLRVVGECKNDQEIAQSKDNAPSTDLRSNHDHAIWRCVHLKPNGASGKLFPLVQSHAVADLEQLNDNVLMEQLVVRDAVLMSI